MIALSLCFLGGGVGGEEGNGTLPDGSQSGPAGTSPSGGQSVNLRRGVARAQSRYRLANKPQDFQVSLIINKDQ